MKNLFICVIILLLSLMFVSSALATPVDPTSNTAVICKSLAKEYPAWFKDNFSSHGDCVSFHRLQQVDWCKEMYNVPGFDFGNIGLCVSFVRAYYR